MGRGCVGTYSVGPVDAHEKVVVRKRAEALWPHAPDGVGLRGRIPPGGQAAVLDRVVVLSQPAGQSVSQSLAGALPFLPPSSL